MGFADVVDAAYVRVRYLTGETNFRPQATARPFIRTKQREELQRDLLTEFEVVCSIDLAHAPMSQRSNNPEASSEEGAGAKTAFVRYRGADRRAAGRAEA